MARASMTVPPTLESVALESVTEAIVDSTIQTTTSNPNYAATGLSVTLLPGKWFITYSSTVSATSNNRLIRTAIFIDGAHNNSLDSQARIGAGGGLIGGLLGTSADQVVTTSSTVVEITSSSVVDLRWNTSAGTATMQQRQITAIRIG